MLITKVELEDIKSHHNSKYEFQAGTTAITGANGAGKTTIIEAIAWALFDFIGYNFKDFVRRGANKGAVRVTFKSGLDNRLYTVVREIAVSKKNDSVVSKYRIIDEADKTLVAEKSDVGNEFIRSHLRVEPGTKLEELYRAAIGVPQGTFTAIFLDKPATRKTVFDRLLKVEEYREGAEKLGKTATLIKEKRSEIKSRLDFAEGELQQLAATETEHREVAAEILELEQTIDSLKQEIAERAKTVLEFERAQTALDQAATDLRETRHAFETVNAERATATRDRDTAETARARVVELAPDYQIFLQAETQRHALEREREERDRLSQEKNQIYKSSIDARARQHFLSENLKKSQEAARTVIELSPQITKEELLNAEHKTLLEARADANAARKTVADLQLQIDQKRNEWKELSGKIKDGEKGADAETRVAELEQQFLKSCDDLNQADKAATSLNLLGKQKQDARNEIEKLNQNYDKLRQEIQTLDKFQVQAARVVSLNESETALNEKIANLRAAIELDQKFQREVKNGVCPILPDRCLNLREGEILNGYLSSKSLANQDALKNFEAERYTVAADLKAAREAERNTIKLLSLREQFAQLQKQIDEREKSLDSVSREIAGLAKFTTEKHNELRVEKSKIEHELKAWREAATRFAALEGLRRQIQNLADEGKKLGVEQQKQRETADKFDIIEQQIEINQNSLRELDNPRARAESLRREAWRENDLKTELNATAAQIEKFDQQHDKLENALLKFNQLDEKLTDIRRDLERTQAARDEYMLVEIVAAKLPELTVKLQGLTDQTERLAAQVETAAANHTTAAANYNQENHVSEKTALDSARQREAHVSATFAWRNSRLTQLAEILRRLNEVRDKMHDDLQNQERLRKVWETTDYIRETLKKAAPYVGEILRFEIAREATNMFREVTNEVGRSLKWTEDYEIILDENGYQRPFANLSGGEQMAAALSIRLALLTQLSDVRIAFFDEPTTNLDRERRERLATQIGQIRNFNQLFVISHDDTFDGMDNKVPVEVNAE